MNIRKKVANKVWNFAKINNIVSTDSIVQDINLDGTIEQKKVLLAYLDHKSASEALRKGKTHTNQPRYFQIVQSFLKHNMVIDSCWCNDDEAIKKLDFHEYDYIFGFGRVFEAAYKSGCKACKIIYMTEDPYYVAKAGEEVRLNYLLERHPNFKRDMISGEFSNLRAGTFYLPDQEQHSDYIITQGNLAHFERVKKNIYFIAPNAFKNETYNNPQKNKEKKTFVMFGASSLIRKGTDILVDVFSKNKDWTLYMCDVGITKKLKKIGFKNIPSNIIDLGFVDIESNQLKNLFSKCRYILLPSCTEAPSSAVVTGMRHGLIPIVSRGIGLDEYKDYCYYFDGFKVEQIEAKIKEVLEVEETELTKRSEDTYEFANKIFTLDHFANTMCQHIDDIVLIEKGKNK